MKTRGDARPHNGTNPGQGIPLKEALPNCVLHLVKWVDQYVLKSYQELVIFEFLLPLTHETKLRLLLDRLFYTDSLKDLISRIPKARIKKLIPKEDDSADTTDEYVLNEIVGRFVGYSISLASGRFRGPDPKSREDAVKHQDRTGERYLIDETTGIVRFIFRLKGGLAAEKKDWKDIFDPPKKRKLGIADQRKLDQERAWVRFIFWKIFVRSIIEAVNGEEEVWLLEGGREPMLHVWDREKGRA